MFFHGLRIVFNLLFMVSCLQYHFHICRMLFSSIILSTTICSMAISVQHQKKCMQQQSWQESTMQFFECQMVTTLRLGNEDSSSQVSSSVHKVCVSLLQIPQSSIHTLLLSHGIIESVRLGKAFKIKSKHYPRTAKTITKPCS